MSKALIILAIVTLISPIVSVGQNFRKDLETGLYFSSPDWIQVQQLVSDTLKRFKILESKLHFDRVAQVLFDSVPKIPIFRPRKSSFDLGRMDDILKVNKKKYSVIYRVDSGFSAYTFVKADIGYEMYFSVYKVDKKDLRKAIIQDTVDYFTVCEFTLADIKELKKLKDFNTVSQTDFEAFMSYIEKNKGRYSRQVQNNKMRSMYGTFEATQMWGKALLALKYNPLMMPDDFEKVYKKYRPDR